MAKTFVERALAKGAAVVSRIDKVLTPKETYTYQTIRRMHCAKKKGSHECQGAVTITRDGIVLNCPLCGDVKGSNAPTEEPLREDD